MAAPMNLLPMRGFSYSQEKEHQQRRRAPLLLNSGSNNMSLRSRACKSHNSSSSSSSSSTTSTTSTARHPKGSWRAASMLLSCSLGLSTLAVVARADDSWSVVCNRDCDGVDTCKTNALCEGELVETSGCPDNPDCPAQDDRCPSVDCQWHQWSAWSDNDMEFTGLCTRKRDFTPNRCGGSPCIGAAAESMYCRPEERIDQVQDCEFSVWSGWTQCDPVNLQRSRARMITAAPSRGGRACEGPLKETEPCGVRPEPRDCQLSDWMPWSGCSHPCGGGQHIRVRSIQQQAKHGGKLCGTEGDDASKALQEIKACNEWACAGEEKQDCVLGDWSPWGDCDGSQQVRIRKVAKPAAYGGEACDSSLKEIRSCARGEIADLEKVDCQLSEWTPWSLCSRSCLGGQTTRSREIATPAAHGGRSCGEVMTSERKPCNDFACVVTAESKDCSLTQWSGWSDCSSHCGQGVQTRLRNIQVNASVGGLACSDLLEEARACEGLKECDVDDCAWGDWTGWTVCSQTCGGGVRSRNRSVAVHPTRGGAACEAQESIEEVEPCNTAACYETCIDGLWDNWEDWSDCSRSCGSGVSWRHRGMAIAASPCGEAVEGDASEVRRCEEGPCPGDKDCELTDWTEWGDCSATCDGIQSRARAIVVEGAGMGKLCGSSDDDMQVSEARSCNDAKSYEALAKTAAGANSGEAALLECGFEGHEPVDCALNDWEDWSTCTASCDGGQKTRERKIQRLPRNGGRSCSDPLKEIHPCNTDPCEAPQDCEWGPWQAWGDCTRCDGERMRTRMIVSRSVGRGKECTEGDAKEIEKCDECIPEKLLYCLWGDWSHGECSVTCGTNGWETKIRKLEGHKVVPTGREAEVVGNVTGDYANCVGSEVRHVACAEELPACDVDGCEPVDCKFGDWMEWESPKHCEGLCSRSRKIVEKSSCKGKPCEGWVTETKVCPSDECKQDTPCTMGAWSPWTQCKAGVTQRTRERAVEQTPGNAGDVCEGALQETAACDESTVEEAMDCELTPWSPWTECSRSCGGGQQAKSRDVLAHAVGGGRPCNATLKVVRPCGEGTCDPDSTDCGFSEWEAWSGCDTDETLQATRTRSVVAARADGRACVGALIEAGPCQGVNAIDCQWSEWADWGACGADCGGGQRFRTREIAVQASFGGALCDGNVIETESCNDEPCHQDDCQLSDWSSWSTCNGTCGQGQQSRSRQILQAARSHGDGCTLALEESRGCEFEGGECSSDKDCRWGQWFEWSGCFKAEECGIGYRRRTREIEVHATGAGKPCAAATVEEVAPSHSCPGSCDHRTCIDGAWDDWGAWEQCSVTCGQGGVQSRARVVRIEANSCGKPAEGESREYRTCGSSKKCESDAAPNSQDCVFGPWTAWEPPVCPEKCNGEQRRSRTIVRYSSNGGFACEGPTAQVTRCNPLPDEHDPPGCNSGSPVDCVLEEWSSWSKCGARCGTGHISRTRGILQSPQFGGKTCDSSLAEIRECNASVPCVDWSVDCQFADWNSWSECDDVTKQKRRERHIRQLKVGFGDDCDGPQVELAECKSECKDKKYSCAWAAWSSWSVCSSTCGPEGRRTRVKQLRLSLAEETDKSDSPAELNLTETESGSISALRDLKLPHSHSKGLRQEPLPVMLEYEKLQAQVKSVADAQFRENVLAFVAGVGLLGFFFVTLRGRGRRPFSPTAAALVLTEETP